MRIVIEADTIAEFDQVIAHLAGKGNGATAAAPKTEPKATPAKDTVKDEKPKDPAKDAAKESEISYAKDIAPRVLKLAEAKGRPAALEVLAKFGVEKAPQLKAEQYPAFIAAVDTALDV